MKRKGRITGLGAATAALLLAAASYPVPAHAAADLQRLSGLFHSEREESLLLEAMRRPPAPATPRPVSADLHLSAIIYLGPDNWVIWINGRPLRSGEQHGSLRVLKVTPAQVLLTADQGDRAGLTPIIALRPQQSYLAATGQIVDKFVGGPTTKPLLATP
ncbi:hypothetical protein [Polaromonas sp.]|uniref:hypothetical protein n=1 Tax=Polaromonas sp. TaxID=1869339 RepID=UPI003566CA97